MPNKDSTSTEHLEHARDIIWDAMQRLEEAQRVLFRAGDRYVTQVWGDGVRAVLEVTEKMSDLAGDLTSVHIEIGKIAQRDRKRGPDPSP